MRRNALRGAEHFKAALKRFKPQPPEGMPAPDDAWGAWVEYRLKRLEDGQQWMLRVILGALLAEVVLEVIKL
jgi:hypothetical protein